MLARIHTYTLHWHKKEKRDSTDTFVSSHSSTLELLIEPRYVFVQVRNVEKLVEKHVVLTEI